MLHLFYLNERTNNSREVRGLLNLDFERLEIRPRIMHNNSVCFGSRILVVNCSDVRDSYIDSVRENKF